MSAEHREPAGRRIAIAGTGGTIRRRVARILALPAVVVLLLLSAVAAGQVQDYRTSRATSASVTLALAVQGLVHELQTERGVTAGVLGGNPSFRNELAGARARVDRQRSALDRLVSGGGAIEGRVQEASRQLDGLPAVRAATDAGTAGRDAVFGYYTGRIGGLAGVDVGLDLAGDERLRQGAQALQALGDAAEGLAQERAFLNGIFSAGGFARGEFVRFAEMRAAEEVALDRFDRSATAEQRAAKDYVFDTGPARVTAHFEQVALDAADGRHVVVNPQSWWSGLTTVLDDLRQLQQHVGSQIQVRAHTLQQRATQQIAALLAVVLLCLVGSVYLATLASRSITRPLAALAAEADNVAAERLQLAVNRVQAADENDPPRPPDPVRVPARATEEIRSVATALDHLQTAAYGLATEQAMQRRSTIESLANLGRRNQNLIRRQLGFITSLEREELDPAALANLFELDHLATRMRRNAASLLVLVGASSPRTWSTGVPVADVIRAAVSEVEEYRRVSLRRVDDTLVTGAAVGSMAHLLSELIENGLMFSPPDSDVEVQGRRLADGYLIAITDQGVGMTADELARANARLRGEGDFISAPTRFLGHYVVGRLAGETSIKVELLPSPVTGVTARVTVPGALLNTLLAVPAGPVHAHVDVAEPTPRHSLSAIDAPAAAQLTAGPASRPEPERITVAAAGARRPAVAVAPSLPGAPGQRPAMPGAPGPGSARTSTLTSTPTGAASGPPMPARSGPMSGPPMPTGPRPTGAGSTGPRPTGPTFGPPMPARDQGSSGPEPTERTRNGLRKRMPRELRSSTGPPAPPPSVIDLDAAIRPMLVPGSPADISARLTAFRAGMRRGQDGQVVASAGRPAPGDGNGNGDGGHGRSGSEHSEEPG